MAGLPHFTSAKAAVSLYEPVYLNQFEVIIQPPAAVSNPAGTAGRTLMVENVTQIGGLAVDKTPAPVMQNYKFAGRRYAGAAVDDTGVKITVNFQTNLDDNNSNYVHKTLRQWSDLIYNPLTGAMGVKSDYVGSMVISIFNKRGDVFRRMVCKDCFPMKPIDAMDLRYTGTDIYAVNMTWAVDYFEDVFN
jgi:hypothetical protein